MGPLSSLALAAITMVGHLTTNDAHSPIGIDDPAPRFAWRLKSTERGVRQEAFRLFVASSREKAREGAADVWDSNRVAAADPWTVYAGPALRSGTGYYWSVQVWTEGAATPLAPPVAAQFETAYLASSEWRGRWIAGPERSSTITAALGVADDAQIRAAGEFCRPPLWLAAGFAAERDKNDQGECRELRPAPLLRRTFDVRKPVARARVYASGLGYAEVRVNGAAVSESVLDPGFTDYGKTVLYTTRDVRSLLLRGRNAITAELGSGQFDNAAHTWDWGWERAQWRATPRLRLDLVIDYEDGTQDVVATDGSWKVSTDGPTRYDNYYLGETYDARRQIPDWDRAGFDDASWSPARVVDGPAGTLRAQAHEPIRVVKTLPPGQRTEPAPGVIVYDVGQNLTGWAEVSVHAPAGAAVEIFYSEKRGPDGRASTDGNLFVYGQLQTDEYVSDGRDARWTPRFSYKGFQYVQLSGPGGAPLPPGVEATVTRVMHTRSSLDRTSTFVASNPTLQHIHDNTVWAVGSNLAGIVTDTPVYEKNGWTGDAQLTSGTASLLFDTSRLYRKMFQDMRDEQTGQGEVPLLSPSNVNYGYLGKPYFKPEDCCGATPPWDAFWFVIPWEAYMRTGDRRALEKTYPAMRLYLDQWIPRWTGKDGDAFAHTLTSGLGDWLPPKDVPTLNALASTAYYARFAQIARDAAQVLGETADAARYTALFDRIRADFNARFLGADGVYREKAGEPFAQTAQILPLAFGLAPDEKRAALAARLADDITRVRGGNAFVGVLGARYVLPVLTAAGHDGVALAAATQTDEPSWGYWTDVAGFTALGESWPADTRSRNHHMFGSIVQWMYEDLAGVKPLAPGYGVIEFRPAAPATGLDHLAVTYETVRGTLACAWRRTAEGLDVAITVPPTATGRVALPGTRPEAVTEGGRAAARAPAVRLVGVEGDRVVYELGSGSYRFLVRP